jgi:glycosyltransferase involved in cell wall biosynthesis
MIRAIHLIQRGVDSQTRTAADQLARQLGGDFRVATHTVTSEFATLAPQSMRLRRTLADEPHDLIHAFGPAALACATFVGGRIVYTPARFPSRRAIGWLRAVMSHRDVNVVCPTDTMRRAMVEGGAPIERCHLIRPGVEFAKVRRRRDDALRASLGFGPDDCVILAAGESTRAAGHHREAAWAASILHVLSPVYKLLIWGRGSVAESTRRFVDRQHLPSLLSIAEQRLGRPVAFEELLPAADLMLVTATQPVATLPVAIGMAAGLPIVATVTPTVAELLEDRHTALFTTKPLPQLIAQRILDLRNDTSLQWSIADMARTEAYEYFSLSRFLQQHRALYEQVARGAPVEIPQQQPGAGLRFHGRV